MSIAHVEPLQKGSFPRGPVWQSRVVLATVYVACVAGLAVVLASGAVRCPFAELTHVPCPGCGSTRAVRALLAFDVATALRFNPAAPVIVACMAAIAGEGLVRVVRDGTLRNLATRGVGAWALRGLVVATVLEVPIWALRFLGWFGGPVPV